MLGTPVLGPPVLCSLLQRLILLHPSRAHQVMEFDRVVFNEEPGAVYGPGAMPTPWGARERVLARGGGREDTASRMRAPPQPPPVLGASPRGVEHARTLPTGARGATRPRTPTPTPASPRARCAVRTDFGNHLIFLHSCRREGDIPPKRPGR